MEVSISSYLSIKPLRRKLVLLPWFLLLSFTSLSQTTSLVVNYDLRGFPNVSYEDSFVMRYSNLSDSVWLIEHTFHCPKDFHWSDTISPVPEGDIQLTIVKDSIKLLESYYWVTANRLNEVDITINRQYHRSKGAPFISEDFIHFYFQTGANFHEILPKTNYQSASSFYTGFFQGIMVSKRFGVSYGQSLNYETSSFRNVLTSQTHRANYWSWGITPMLRFVPFTYENKVKLKRNTYLDVGAGYYFPLKFRYNENVVGGNTKIVHSKMHNYGDFRFKGSLTIGPMSFFGIYRLTDIIKSETYDQTPPLIFGVGITNQL